MKKLFNILLISLFCLASSFTFAACNCRGKGEDLYIYELSQDGKYIYFGEYPQTIKSEDVTIKSKKPDVNGYYIGSDGERYVKQTVTFDREGLSMSEKEVNEYKFLTTVDGKIDMINGQDYYFKVEKLKWRILSQEGKKALIVCDKIINTTPYQKAYEKVSRDDKTYYYVTDSNGNPIYREIYKSVPFNDYEFSSLRHFLTQEFYHSAFSLKQKNLITTTQIDDCAGTTEMHYYGKYNHQPVNDYVFALSYDDLINPDYGFNSSYKAKDYARVWYVTDYSIANGSIRITKEFGGSDELLINAGMMQTRTSNSAENSNETYRALLDLMAVFLKDTASGGVAPALYINL